MPDWYRKKRRCAHNYTVHGWSAKRKPSTSTAVSDIAASGRLLSCRLLAATLTLLSGGFQLAVALSVNLDLSACKHVFRGHVADRTVQPDVVIAIHILLNKAFCIFQRQRRSRPCTRFSATCASAQSCRWPASTTAPQGDTAGRVFRVIHPFHPWHDRRFEFIAYKSAWGEDRHPRRPVRSAPETANNQSA